MSLIYAAGLWTRIRIPQPEPKQFCKAEAGAKNFQMVEMEP